MRMCYQYFFLYYILARGFVSLKILPLQVFAEVFRRMNAINCSSQPLSYRQ